LTNKLEEISAQVRNFSFSTIIVAEQERPGRDPFLDFHEADLRQSAIRSSDWSVDVSLDLSWVSLSAAELETHEGKRKCEALWPIFKLTHQKSRFIYDLFYKRKEISRELYEFCLEQGYADKALIAKWKKVSRDLLLDCSSCASRITQVKSCWMYFTSLFVLLQC
jgi:hypothetical protein